MRKIINSTYVSIDGVVEAPQLWPSLGRTEDEQAAQIQTDLLLACDAVLMGRHTYDGFAPVWATRSGDPMSDRMNAMPKYVVSSTLRDPEWPNTRVIDGDVATAVGRLREEPGQDIVQFGFGPVSRLLLEQGMLDELRLWVYPLMLGRRDLSERLFGDGRPVGFSLTDVTPLSNGIVILSYST